MNYFFRCHHGLILKLRIRSQAFYYLPSPFGEGSENQGGGTTGGDPSTGGSGQDDNGGGSGDGADEN